MTSSEAGPPRARPASTTPSQSIVDARADEAERERRRRLWPDAGALYRAFMLAPNIEIAEALLGGESVPLDRLDAEWVKRSGLKRAA